MCEKHSHFRICCFFAATSIFEASSTVMATTLCSTRIGLIGQAREHTQGIWLCFLFLSMNFHTNRHTAEQGQQSLTKSSQINLICIYIYHKSQIYLKGIHNLYSKRPPLSLDTQLRWGTTPINGQHGKNLRKNSLICPFLKRASVLWFLSSFLLIWTPRYLYPTSSFPLPEWQPRQGASCSSGSPPQAYWFWWYWASDDCRCTMWRSSLSVLCENSLEVKTAWFPLEMINWYRTYPYSDNFHFA